MNKTCLDILHNRENSDSSLGKCLDKVNNIIISIVNCIKRKFPMGKESILLSELFQNKRYCYGNFLSPRHINQLEKHLPWYNNKAMEIIIKKNVCFNRFPTIELWGKRQKSNQS